MDYKQTFIKNLKNFRKENNLTQDDLADILGYSQKNIAKWEQGYSIPSIDVLIELSKKMKLSLDTLMGLDKKTLMDQCAEYVFETSLTPREKIFHFDNGDDSFCETYEDIVYGNIKFIFMQFIFSLEMHNDQSFKNLAQSKTTKENKLIIQFLKDKQHITEINDEWIVSNEFALNCFDFAEQLYLNDLNKEQESLSNYSKQEHTDSHQIESLKVFIEKATNDITSVKQLKEKYFNKD